MASRKRQSVPAVPSVDYPELASTFQAIRKNIAELWEELDAKAAKTQLWELTFILTTVADATFYAIINSTKNIKITEVTTRLTSGTCTLSPQINGIVMSGGTSAVTSSELTVRHIEKNILNVGGDLNFVISASSSPVRLTVTFRGTYSLE